MIVGCDFVLQSERPHHEGTWYYPICLTHPGYRECPTLRAYEEESHFNGRGSKQKAEKALRELTTLAETS